MQTLERTNNRISSECIELLIRERNNGKSLRQLGQMFGRSHERIRQLLAKYSTSQVTLLPESMVTDKLGYPLSWLVQLRKEGIINPIKPGSYWLYSEEQVRQIPSLIDEARKCERCGKLRPPGSQKFCRKCSQYRRKHKYRTLSPEGKAKRIKSCLAWRKANPEKWKEIQTCNDPHESDDLRILDYKPERAYKLFSFKELGPPIYYESSPDGGGYLWLYPRLSPSFLPANL